MMKSNTSEIITKYYSNCTLCPRNCQINRYSQKGVCGASSEMAVSRAALHFWEEPCISGESGSGAVFFSGCNLHCIYCQNYSISSHKIGKEISIERLVEIFYELKDKGANNINLVTGSHFIPSIREAILIAKNKGFTLPFIFNCGGYESVDSLEMLDGLIDVYLPDFKYISSDLSNELSHANNYPEIAKLAISEMYRQVGTPVFSSEGLIKKGMIVRHLVLPGYLEESKMVLDYLYKTYSDNIYISIMSQYTPMPNTKKLPHLKRKLSKHEYSSIISYATNLGIENAYIQEGDVAKESFIPEFDLSGI